MRKYLKSSSVVCGGQEGTVVAETDQRCRCYLAGGGGVRRTLAEVSAVDGCHQPTLVTGTGTDWAGCGFVTISRVIGTILLGTFQWTSGKTFILSPCTESRNNSLRIKLKRRGELEPGTLLLSDPPSARSWTAPWAVTRGACVGSAVRLPQETCRVFSLNSNSWPGRVLCLYDQSVFHVIHVFHVPAAVHLSQLSSQ